MLLKTVHIAPYRPLGGHNTPSWGAVFFGVARYVAKKEDLTVATLGCSDATSVQARGHGCRTLRVGPKTGTDTLGDTCDAR